MGAMVLPIILMRVFSVCQGRRRCRGSKGLAECWTMLCMIVPLRVICPGLVQENPAIRGNLWHNVCRLRAVSELMCQGRDDLVLPCFITSMFCFFR